MTFSIVNYYNEIFYFYKIKSKNLKYIFALKLQILTKKCNCFNMKST
jgi:hypothetical protein